MIGALLGPTQQNIFKICQNWQHTISISIHIGLPYQLEFLYAFKLYYMIFHLGFDISVRDALTIYIVIRL